VVAQGVLLADEEKRMRHALLVTLGLLLATAARGSNKYLFVQPNASAPATISFTAGVVQIAPVSPGGIVYAFSVAREPLGYRTNVVPREALLADENRDGIVEWHFGAGVPVRAVWMAVDLISGAAAAAISPGYRARATRLTDEHVKKDGRGDITDLVYPGSLIEMVVVRPGIGVWAQTVGYRSTKDKGAFRGRVNLALEGLTPRAKTTVPPPAKLQRGDVVFLLNSGRAEYTLYTVGAP
jgi:hypothetical protein